MFHDISLGRFLFFNFGVFCFRLCEGGSAVLCGDGELDRLN